MSRRSLLPGMAFALLAGVAAGASADAGQDTAWIATLRGMTLKQARAAIVQHGWVPWEFTSSRHGNEPYDKGDQRADRFAKAGYDETEYCEASTLRCTLDYVNSTVDTELMLTTDGDTPDSAAVVDTHLGTPQPRI